MSDTPSPFEAAGYFGSRNGRPHTDCELEDLTNSHMRNGRFDEADWDRIMEQAAQYYAEQEEPEFDPQDSIRAPIRKGPARNESWTPIPAPALVSVNLDQDWLWRGYLARKTITLLAAYWKAGKTTLLSHFLREATRGGSLCGIKVSSCKILYITEEYAGYWTKRRDALGFGANVHFIVRPFRARATPHQWLEFLKALEDLMTKEKYDLVIFDTLSKMWSVINENDAGEVEGALMPLWNLTDAGASILLAHHLRKADGPEGTGSRGSGGLPSFVDTIMELRRYRPSDRHDRKRVITAYGRSPATDSVGEVVIELSKDGLNYSTHGDRQEATQAERLNLIEGVLPEQEPGLTVDEVLEAWPGDLKPGKRTVTVDLRCGVDSGRWRFTGEGKKGDPHRHFKGL